MDKVCLLSLTKKEEGELEEGEITDDYKQNYKPKKKIVKKLPKSYKLKQKSKNKHLSKHSLKTESQHKTYDRLDRTVYHPKSHENSRTSNQISKQPLQPKQHLHYKNKLYGKKLLPPKKELIGLKSIYNAEFSHQSVHCNNQTTDSIHQPIHVKRSERPSTEKKSEKHFKSQIDKNMPPYLHSHNDSRRKLGSSTLGSLLRDRSISCANKTFFNHHPVLSAEKLDKIQKYQKYYKSEVDKNSSYEDLLEQYKQIQTQLDSLKQNKNSRYREKRISQSSKIANKCNIKENQKFPLTPIKRSSTNSMETSKQRNFSSDKRHKPECSRNNLALGKKNISEKKENERENFKTPSSSHKSEDEDEQELREKALASFTKLSHHSAFRNKDENNQNVFNSSNCASLKDKVNPEEMVSNTLNSQKDTDQVLQIFCNNSERFNQHYIDNYELVDMEIDSDADIKSKLGSNNFTESEFSSRKDDPENINSVILIKSDSNDEEFDEEILRAELILSLKRKKMDLKPEQEENIDLADCAPGNYINHSLTETVLKDKINTENEVCEQKMYTATNDALEQQNRYIENNVSDEFQDISVNYLARLDTNKSTTPKINNNLGTCPVSNNFLATDCQKHSGSSLYAVHQKPLVISLNDDSSSDSETDIDENMENEGMSDPVIDMPASLELLLKEARMKSDSATSNKNAQNTLKALSCLSKAQQEEYSKLKEIIAKKELHQRVEQISFHPALEELKLLEKKLKIATHTLPEEKQLLNLLKSQVNKKRMAFRNSQLTYQRLKKQLIAAEKVMMSNQLVVHKYNTQLRAVQSSVEKRASLISDLKNECAKLGPQVYGAAYRLPASSLLT